MFLVRNQHVLRSLSRLNSRIATGISGLVCIAIAIVIGSLLNAFLLHNPMLMILISAAVVVLFTIMIVYDTQNIIRGAYSTPIEGAIALYLDFLNLFIALLQLFGIFGGSED